MLISLFASSKQDKKSYNDVVLLGRTHSPADLHTGPHHTTPADHKLPLLQFMQKGLLV